MDGDHKKHSGIAAVIEAIKTPLGFFALIVFLIDGLLTVVMALTQGSDRTLALWGFLTLTAILILTVGFLTHFRPESLTGAKQAETHRTESTIPEKPTERTFLSQINPQFTKDLADLDSSRFDLNCILGRDSVLIVVGDGIVSELLDRVVAGYLRDAIDKSGSKEPFKRGVIVSHRRWMQEREFFSKFHTIAVGGPNVNDVTRLFSDEYCVNGRKPWNVGDTHKLFGVHRSTRPCRLALWGAKAAETRDSVQGYIDAPQRGLADFLGWCWRL